MRFLLKNIKAPTGTTHEIDSQTDWDNLTFGTSDIINLNTDVYGGKPIAKSNVRINGNGNSIIGYSDYSTGWTDNLDGTFTKTDSEPKWLMYNGSIMKKAQTDWIDVNSSPASNQLSIDHSDVSGYTNIVGSTIIYKDRPWNINTYIVLSYNGAGVITLDRDLDLSLDARCGFKLSGKSDYFSGDNEWAYEGGDIIIKSLDTNVQKIDYDNLLTIQGSFFACSNLILEGAFKYCILRTFGDNTSITSCTLSKCKGVGVALANASTTSTVSYNTISDMGYGGITTQDIQLVICEYNNISNIGIQGNLSSRPSSDISIAGNSAIKIRVNNGETDWISDGCQINYNTINSVAYCGIKIRGQNNLIRYNIITDVMQNLSDGGAIYSFGGNNNATLVDATNNTYEYNFIDGSPGSHEGLTGVTLRARGFHMDDETFGAIIRYNIVQNCNDPMLAKGHSHIVENNIFITETTGVRWFTLSPQSPPLDNVSNNFNNNIVVSKLSTVPCMSGEIGGTDADYSPYDIGGSADNNYYINPYGNLIANDDNVGDMTLAQLRTTWGEDANSIAHSNYITAPGDPDNEILLITNPTDSQISGYAPAGSWYDVDSNLVTDYTVDAWSGLVLLKDLI